MRYTCEVCKEDCESDESQWTNEDAIKERDELWAKDFGPFGIVCDPCFKQFMHWYEINMSKPEKIIRDDIYI